MSQETTTLAALRKEAAPAAAPDIHAGLDTVGGFELMQRAAKLFAQSDMVPNQYKGSIANCVIAVDMAMRMGANPLMVMQNLYLVHNRPAWSAKFLIATFNKCGRFSAMRFEFQGREGEDGWGCRAVARELATDAELSGPLVTVGLAKKEGWYGRNGSKWPAMPELMLRYRAASWFVGVYAPELAMGLQTVEEVRDTWDLEPAQDGSYAVNTDEIRTARPAAPEEAAQMEKEGEEWEAEQAAKAAQDTEAGTGEPANPASGNGPWRAPEPERQREGVAPWEVETGVKKLSRGRGKKADGGLLGEGL